LPAQTLALPLLAVGTMLLLVALVHMALGREPAGPLRMAVAIVLGVALLLLVASGFVRTGREGKPPNWLRTGGRFVLYSVVLAAAFVLKAHGGGPATSQAVDARMLPVLAVLALACALIGHFAPRLR